ncbi:MAG: MCE family protein [Chthoniobacterales bacterium]|nr:MCE family protein [Chthoniobacterales bacterium]
MQLRRNEIMTGVLVLASVAILTFILILLGAPGLFRPLVVYRLYFDNASGINLGAPVLLAGRKVGQVKSLNSPVSREEAAHAVEAAGNLGSVNQNGEPGTALLPRFEVRIDVEVDRTALVYKNSTVRLMTLGLLGETAIDISGGDDHAKRAEPGQVFVGNRVPDFSEAIAKLLGIVGPVATEASSTLKQLQSTAANLSKITDENSQLTLALGQFKTFGEHLNEITGSDSSLQKSLDNIRNISEQLSRNDNLQVTLANFRKSSEDLKSTLGRVKLTLDSVGPELEATLNNTKDFTATLKAQPWRLIYPTTKKYPNESASPTPSPARKRSR